MSDVTGTVEVVTTRGKATNIKVGDEWYGCGFKGFPYSKGDTVSFDVIQRGKYKNVDMDSLKKVEGASSNSSSASNYSPASNDNRQKSIAFQSSRKDAIEVAKIAVANELISIPAAKAKRLDVVLALIDELTVRYYAEVEGVQSGEYDPLQEVTPGGNSVETDEGDLLEE